MMCTAVSVCDGPDPTVSTSLRLWAYQASSGLPRPLPCLQARHLDTWQRQPRVSAGVSPKSLGFYLSP